MTNYPPLHAVSSVFDLDGFGLTADDLDLDFETDDLPPLRLDRPRYRSKGWWSPTPAEAFHLDLPDFESASQRTHYMIRDMGRAALARRVGATADDPIFPHRGEMVSLNHLLAMVSRDAVDDLTSFLDAIP